MTIKPNNTCIGQAGSSQQFKEPFKGGGHGGGTKSLLAGEAASLLSESSASAGVPKQSQDSPGQLIRASGGDQ